MQALFDYVLQFCPLSKAAQKSLEEGLQKKELLKGSYLIREGAICNHVYFLERGCVRGFYNHDGKEITHWFAFENNFVTSFFSFITRKPCVENIQCLEDSMLWAVSYDDLQELYSKHVAMERLGRIMNEQYYVVLEERFVSNHFKEAKERYEN